LYFGSSGQKSLKNGFLRDGWRLAETRAGARMGTVYHVYLLGASILALSLITPYNLSTLSTMFRLALEVVILL
jgi:hypothetical protein